MASTILAIPLALLRAAPAALIQRVINDLGQHMDMAKLRFYAFSVIGLYLANFAVRFGHYYFLRIVTARVDQKIKNDLFQHLLGLSADYFTAQSTGALISRATQDVTWVSIGLSTLNSLIREPATFLCLLGYALYLNWRLTVLTFFVLPPLAWVFAATARNLKRYIHRIQDANTQIFSTLQESFSGIRVVKLFRLEKYVRKKFRERSDRYTHFILKTAVLEEASHPMVELLTAFMIACVVFYGGREVLLGRMKAGDLFAFFAAFGLMMNPLRMVNDVNIKLNQTAAACDRIFEIFGWKSNIVEAPDAARLREFNDRIAFKGVTFAYPDALEREVLKNVSFEVTRGSVVALAGASGAGKSSLVSLLPRVFDVTGGAIEIDGRDIRSVRIDDIRDLIAVVSQDVFLFNDTIEENIRCGRLSATREEVREAARRAHAFDFIESLPEGFQSVVGDRGQKLSGGERQRISIARAFLRSSPILILDEATSSLDATSERAVQAALEELMKDRTTIVIAHRLSTIRNADAILVLKEGRIIERGKHDELVRAGGEYAHFHALGHSGG